MPDYRTTLHVFSHEGVLYTIRYTTGSYEEPMKTYLESEHGQETEVKEEGLGGIRKAIEELEHQLEFDEDRKD